MKTNQFIIQQLICLILLTSIISCDSFVEVELPKSQLTAPAVFEDYNTASAALTSIYANIRDKGILAGNGTGISNQLANYADEMTSNEKPTNPSVSFYTNSLLPSNTIVKDYWISAYNQIYAANSVIVGIQAGQNLTEDQKKQLQGEALFIRAMLHFYLVNIFGDIPYITKTDYKVNSTVKRIPSLEVYQNIIADLQVATEYLTATYISNQRTRPNSLAVKALLSRVYLYAKKYPEASNTASAVLNQQGIYSLENTSNAFLINSKETIWQLQSGAAGLNTADGSFFIFTSTPPPYVSMSAALVSSFAGSDLRWSSWIKGLSNNTSTWYYPFKYKENIPTSSSKEYSVFFRLAEQFLIRSEARVYQGDLIGAKEDLNKIRLRAGLKETTAATQTEIIDAILSERQHELFTEYGHRFFDLKRSGKLDSALSVKKGWNTTDSLFPIPISELSANPNLRPQNPGY